MQIIFGLAALLSTMIVFEIDNDPIWRVVATLSIIGAALTLIIPILHRLGRTEQEGAALRMPLEERNLATIDEEIARTKSRLHELEKLRREVAGDG